MSRQKDYQRHKIIDGEGVLNLDKHRKISKLDNGGR
jgi:hypothetical protein